LALFAMAAAAGRERDAAIGAQVRAARAISAPDRTREHAPDQARTPRQAGRARDLAIAAPRGPRGTIAAIVRTIAACSGGNLEAADFMVDSHNCYVLD